MSVGPLPSPLDLELEADAPRDIPDQGPVDRTPLERLDNEELHTKVLVKLKARKNASQRKMSQFYDRWRANENRFQAYLASKDLDQIRKASNDRGTPPEILTITVPYTYATIMTIVTYLLHTFCGQKPIFQTDAYRDDMVERSQKMEVLLQYNADHERAIRRLYQYFTDGEMYGLQAMRVMWKAEVARRTRWQQPQMPLLGGTLGLQPVTVTETLFEGNELINIDPFAFFPDPSVPMDEVAVRGEYVFWEHMAGRHLLKKAEAQGLIAYVSKIPRGNQSKHNNISERAKLAAGDGSAGRVGIDLSGGQDQFLLTQGTIDLIPSEWGLGDSDEMEKYLFTWANDAQIIQCEPLDADHGKHPVIVGEPYSTGYGFGNSCAADMVGPMQDTLSWLINSHMFNVRAILNNTLVVNPQMIDMQDLKKGGPGRVIKMLPAAFGQDPKNAVSQLAVQDVTRTHIQDMQVITRLADMISAVNDNLRGITNSGGRKTATEVRTGNEAGASRLASHAVLTSSQSIVPLAEMMSLNYQQNVTMEFYLKTLGPEASPLKIRPEDLAGDYNFPVHDGTLPMDRVALMQVWKEILVAMMQNPAIAVGYNLPGIFEYTAKLGGAKNITQFKLRNVPDESLMQAAAAGNAVPMGEAMGSLPQGMLQ